MLIDADWYQWMPILFLIDMLIDANWYSDKVQTGFLLSERTSGVAPVIVKKRVTKSEMETKWLWWNCQNTNILHCLEEYKNIDSSVPKNDLATGAYIYWAVHLIMQRVCWALRDVATPHPRGRACLCLVWPQLLKTSSALISPLTWPANPYVTLQAFHARYCRTFKICCLV